MRFKPLAILTLTATMLTACGDDDVQEKKESHDSDDKVEHTQTSPETQKSKAHDAIALKDIKSNPKEAIKKAQEVYSNHRLKKVSFEHSNGEWVYKIEQQSKSEETEVILSDNNLKVLSKHVEKEASLLQGEFFKYSDTLDYKAAIEKAKTTFNGDIEKWSLEKDDGKLIYHVSLKKDATVREFDIDAESGEILKTENEHHDHEDKDHDHNESEDKD